ncbi:threonine--tRNA ligase [Candidatus Parcubacteria bacterium]|nr:MAG: threonine--tRNA ligase [Candidatus Parcubacteria bacterium]
MSQEQFQDTLEAKRHSLAHILAAAVAELYPGVKFAIGPNIENGCYYDFDFGGHKVGEEDLPKIEQKMRQLIKKNLTFQFSVLPASQALEQEKQRGQVYKAELVADLIKDGHQEVSYYQVGDFKDLCSGPHIQHTSKLQKMGFKLHRLAGAYWRGDEKNKMLTRIYVLAFESVEELNQYLELLKKAEESDHRRLAKELELFMISDEVGKGLPLWLPNGAFIRKKLEDYMYKKERQAGYHFVYTPVLTREELYQRSGHLAHYREDMYNPIDIEGENYYLKPMNCPHHHIMYKNTPKSYRDLPLRYADFGLIHRFERSGTLTGLIRARCFTQNDAHIYCRRQQVKDELLGVLRLFKEVYTDFKIKGYWFRLSLPDFSNQEKYGDIKNREMWEESAQIAREAMQEFGAPYAEAEGEAAFYGPKIDVQIKNVFGKEDTIATVQVDFYMPERFDLKFINEKGEEERPVIIHRAIMGSFDRFFSFLVEQCGGAFPIWLSPLQAVLISVGESHKEFCRQLAKKLDQAGVRVRVDDSDETVGNKTRKAIKSKVPYIVVIGDKEKESGQLAVRRRGSREVELMDFDSFVAEVKKKEKEKE